MLMMQAVGLLAFLTCLMSGKRFLEGGLYKGYLGVLYYGNGREVRTRGPSKEPSMGDKMQGSDDHIPEISWAYWHDPVA